MNRIKAACILLTLFAIASLFPLKTEAAIHLSTDPQAFCDSYNFWAEDYNRRNIGEPIPLIGELTPTENNGGYKGFFDDNLPEGRIFIAIDEYGRMRSIWVGTYIDEYTQLNGKTVPADIFTL